jgi:GNAT superfamily N-acetyltransferase
LENNEIIVRIAHSGDGHYAELITEEMASSAKARGTGIAKRSPDYIRTKMEEGKAVIALMPNGDWVGFCYIEAWSHGKFVANSGLIVSPHFRGTGVATKIKEKVFQLSREKYPASKIFGLTTGLAVMKINSELGYRPVTYSELTDDEEFWKGCQSCVNYDILMAKGRKNCLCTGMLFDPAWDPEKKEKDAAPTTSGHDTDADGLDKGGNIGAGTNGGGAHGADHSDIHGHEFAKKRRLREFATHFKLYERWLRFKAFSLLKRDKEESATGGSSLGQRKTCKRLFWDSAEGWTQPIVSNT